jgi:hypothetical protein
MFPRDFLPFYPHKIAYLGAAVLGVCALVSGVFLSFLWSHPLDFSLEKPKKTQESTTPLTFSLGLRHTPFSIHPPHISQDLTFSLDAPRPDQSSLDTSLFIKLKKTAQSKRVILPCRLYLEYIEGDKLRFCDSISSFWIDLDSLSSKKIEGKVFIETPLSEKIEVENFTAIAQEIPIQSPQELAEGSPFRILSEAKWGGADRFREKYEHGALYQKIEVNAQPTARLLDFQEGEWLIWTHEGWVKGSLEEGMHRPVAKIKSVQPKLLILEGWEGNQYIQVALSQQVEPFKMKVEELFNAIRVRSTKQISCMLDKQWLILKLGDWVLKTEGKWKILKKKEEKELYKAGKMGGELFVFEKIESKLGQKLIQIQLFSADRSQVIFSELPVHGMKKGKNEGDFRKGNSVR